MAISPYMKSGRKTYRAKFKYKETQYSKSGFTSKEAAQEWIVKERRKIKAQEGKKATEGNKTYVLMYSEACTRYLEDCDARMQKGTVSDKLHHLTSFVTWIGKDVPFIAISAAQARDYASHILRITQRPKDPKKTANRHIRDLKALWNWHIRHDFQGTNPFKCVEPYPEDDVARYVPPAEDVAKVLQVAESWQQDFLHVLAKTGARPGEVRALTWDDVDLSRVTITFWTRKRKGGARQPRTINMSPQLLELMQRRFAIRTDENVVFPNPLTGKPLGRLDRPYRYMMERLCEKAQVRFFSFYSLRHFVATRLRDSGKANRFEIQLILGHMRSDTTDRYLRGLAPDVKDAISTLDTVLDMESEEQKRQPPKLIRFSRGAA